MTQIKYMNQHSYPKQEGFTIIEVILYLAIAGLVFTIGISFLGGRSAQVQFTDSMRSLNNLVQLQYNQFVNGVRPVERNCEYPSTTGQADIGAGATTDGTCIYFAKVFLFDDANPDRIYIYNLVGRNLNEDQYGDPAMFGNCHSNDFSCIDPTFMTTGEEHVLLWGTEFTKGNESSLTIGGRAGNNVDNLRGFGFVREPISRSVLPIVFSQNISASDLDNNRLYKSHAEATAEFPPANTAMNTEFDAAFCFEGANGQRAALILGDRQSQGVVGLDFGDVTDSGSHDCT